MQTNSMTVIIHKKYMYNIEIKTLAFLLALHAKEKLNHQKIK